MVLSHTETQVQSVESFSSKRKALSKNALISPNASFGHFFQKNLLLRPRLDNLKYWSIRYHFDVIQSSMIAASKREFTLEKLS